MKTYFIHLFDYHHCEETEWLYAVKASSEEEAVKKLKEKEFKSWKHLPDYDIIKEEELNEVDELMYSHWER